MTHSNTVGTTVYDADRFEVADINVDGRPDIVVAEESGREFGASVYWFEQPADLGKAGWSRHQVIVQNTTNSMDVADMDAARRPGWRWRSRYSAETF